MVCGKLLGLREGIGWGLMARITWTGFYWARITWTGLKWHFVLSVLPGRHSFSLLED